MCLMHLRSKLILIIVCCFIPFVYALTDDFKQRIYINADSSTYNYKTGINSFEGNVSLTQGTTHLTADRLITKTNTQRKVNEIIAYGIKQTAHYWTIPKASDPELHAKAMVIKFYPIAANIILEQNVTVTQGENSFQGQLIHYNRNDETITVPALEKNRALLVYNPE